VGVLRYGTWDPGDPAADSRVLWHRDGADVVVRVPWALAGFADPPSRPVLVPRGRKATAVTADDVGQVVSIDGVDRYVGTVTWEGWQRVGSRPAPARSATHSSAPPGNGPPEGEG
jgi:hypothetical protein